MQQKLRSIRRKKVAYGGKKKVGPNRNKSLFGEQLSTKFKPNSITGPTIFFNRGSSPTKKGNEMKENQS